MKTNNTILIGLLFAVIMSGTALASSASIISYYEFNSSNPLLDDTGRHNFTQGAWGTISAPSSNGGGCMYTTCLNLNANSSINDLVNITEIAQNSTEWWINWWGNETNTAQNSNFWSEGDNQGVGIAARAQLTTAGTNINYEGNSGGIIKVTGLTAPTNNMWTYTSNTSGSAVYKNGVFQSINNTVTDWKKGKFGIGHNGVNTNNRLIGTEDEISIGNGSITPAIVTCLYNSGRGINYTSSQQCFGINPTPPTTVNFSITAINNYTGTSFTTFNASINTQEINPLIDQSGNGNDLSIESLTSANYNFTTKGYTFNSSGAQLISKGGLNITSRTNNVIFNYTQNFTLGVRFIQFSNTSNSTHATGFIGSVYNTNARFGIYFLSGSNQYATWGIRNSTGNVYNTPSTPISLNILHELIGIYNSSNNNLSLYLDGTYSSSIKFNSTAFPGFLTPSSSIFGIGDSGSILSGNGIGYNNGTIFRVYVWNSTLTNTEISNLYNNISIPTNNMVAYYPFDYQYPVQYNYTTTTGQINTTLNSSYINSNITVYAASPGSYFPNITLSQNLSSNLVAQIFPWANITTHDIYDNTTVSNFIVVFNGSNYSTTSTFVQIPVIGNYNVSVCPSTYFCNSGNGTGNTLLNISVFQAVATFNSYEIVSGLAKTLFQITAPNITNNSATPVFYIKAGTYNVTWNKTNWFNYTGTFTIPALSNATYNLTGVYQYLLNISARNIFNGSLETTFSANISSGAYSFNQTNSTTNNNSIVVPWTNESNINITTFNALGTSFTSSTFNYSQLITPVMANLTVNASAFNSILFIFRDEINGSIINQTTVTAQLSGTTFSTNFTTTTGTGNVSLLTPEEYTITYGAPGYNQRQYVYTLVNQSTTTLTLYLRNSSASTTVLIQVRDQSLQKVIGAQVNVNIKNNSGTSDYLVEMCTTDINGQCLISADVSTSTYHAPTIYRFTVVYNSITVGDSDYTGISATANSACNSALPCIQLLVTLSQSPLVYFFEIPQIQYQPISYATGTSIFSFSFNDIYNNAQQVCLRTYMNIGVTRTLINSSCITTSSGSLSVFTNTSLGDSTIAIATVVVNGQELQLDDYTVPNNTQGTDSNVMAILFMGLGVLSVVFFAYRGQATLALIMVGVVLNILFLISGLPNITKGFIVAAELVLLFLVTRFKE